MNAFYPNGAAPNGYGNFLTTAVVEEPAPQGSIDAVKVPESRTVVFGGSIRVVSFPGSIRTVEF